MVVVVVIVNSTDELEVGEGGFGDKRSVGCQTVPFQLINHLTHIRC